MTSLPYTEQSPRLHQRANHDIRVGLLAKVALSNCDVCAKHIRILAVHLH